MKQIINYTDQELKDLVKKIVKDGQVVLYEQKMTMNQYAGVLTRIGEVEELDYFMNPKEERRLSYVSGQVDKDGYQIGMFGDQELQWHANGTGRYNFKEICVGLYCVYECIDTVLSINNNCNAFADLSEEKKNYYRSLDIGLDNSPGKNRLWPKDSDYKLPEKFRLGQEHYKENVDRRPLVGIHPFDGREYIYCMVPWIHKAYNKKDGKEIEDFEGFYKILCDDVIKSKYQSHHVFKVGDLLLMDQLNTIHRRSPIKDKDRMLWRTAFSYSNIKND